MSKGKESKPHIGIFGRRNNGKSSFINAIAGQDIAIVSDVAGTTTDPVKKSMEISGIGPVVLVDTAGIDDEGDLGKKRIAKSLAALKNVDLAILIITGNTFGSFEDKLVEDFNDYGTPFIIIHNKSDISALDADFQLLLSQKFPGVPLLEFSAVFPVNRERIIHSMRTTIPPSAWKKSSLLGDLLSYGDLVLLITPIDIEAPEGRLILPQVQAIRDILDNDCVCVVVKEREVDSLIKVLHPRPALVVTDSQVFLKADASIPGDIPLTSFSIMLARHKGDFENYVKGTPKISELKDNDRILLLESCTHHVACDDIGRVKIPRWMNSFTGKKLEYDVVSGLNDLPRPINDYALVVQCGGCVITPKQIKGRLKPALDANVAVTNYGMAIAWMHGIFKRAVAPFLKVDASAEDYL
ncbi:MAG: [FeFe] hydrogenase H-cluster maturation GTPase HydF [Bacteroidetes bacterium]|nr:MAG: [FeFe] hydrogenase H-cluster maturation GTPase HydF [Bacteroidota bacterium]